MASVFLCRGAASAGVWAGCWALSAAVGAVLASLLLPLLLAAVVRSWCTRTEVCLTVPFGNGASSSQAFSSKSCCYLRSRFSCMIRAKGEFISRLHLQQIERQISWGKRRCSWSNKTCKNMGPLGNTALGRASQDTSQFFVKGRYTTLIKRNP